LIRLLPELTEVRVFDNSGEADPATGLAPTPLHVLHMAQGHIVTMCDLAEVPDWAKPIVAAAMKSSQ
jgi:hypothetical protein